MRSRSDTITAIMDEKLIASAPPLPQPDADVQTFRGETIEEIQAQILAELGPSAFILTQREGVRGGMGGFFAKRCIEVDAVPGTSPLAVEHAGANGNGHHVDLYDDPEPVGPSFKSTLERLNEAERGRPGLATVSEPAPPIRERPPTHEPAATVREPAPAPVRAPSPAATTPDTGSQAPEAPTVETSAPELTPEAPEPVSPRPVPSPTPVSPARELRETGDGESLLDELVAQGVSHGFAAQLIELAQAVCLPFAAGDMREALRQAIAFTLPAQGPFSPRGATVAICGSGGSGKTSTAASLAAAYCRSQLLKPALFAPDADDRRAGKALLKGKPVEIITGQGRGGATRALAKHQAGGFVVVDTAAAAPADLAKLDQLRAQLTSISLDAIYLAVPATLSVPAARRLADGYAAAGIDFSGLVMTHADESDQLGIAIELSYQLLKPLVFIHQGTDPDSALSLATPRLLAERLLP